jgi:hypothetical protein
MPGLSAAALAGAARRRPPYPASQARARGRHFMVGGSCADAGGRGAAAGAAGAGPQPAAGNRVFGPGVIGADPTLGTDADAPPAPGGGAPGARADEGGRYGAQGVSQVGRPGARAEPWPCLPGRGAQGGAYRAPRVSTSRATRFSGERAAAELCSACLRWRIAGRAVASNLGSGAACAPSCPLRLGERAGHARNRACTHLRATHTVARQGVQMPSAASGSKWARQSRWA